MTGSLQEEGPERGGEPGVGTHPGIGERGCVMLVSLYSYATHRKEPGIWTKHIKAKTELHQTILDRCLKSLVQKKLVKAVSGSVQVR